MGKKKNKRTPAVTGRAGRQEKTRANRQYKDTVFRMLFREKERLLGLYNAVSGRAYRDAERLDIVTLESAIYLGMKNDVAFLIDMRLYLFEHQSTVNYNMPLRFLQYVSAEYGRLTTTKNLHHRTLIKIPAPHFVVFFNGTEKCAERRELRLSTAYEVPEEEPELELKVQVLNINEGFNEGLKEACHTLREYMQYVDKVRMYAGDMPIDAAVDRAVDECISQGILREFLVKNKAEVRRMSIFEYSEKDLRKLIRKESYEKGKSEGKIEGKIEDILYFLTEKGTVPKSLEERIAVERDEETLRRWLRLAGSVEDIDEFIEACGFPVGEVM